MNKLPAISPDSLSGDLPVVNVWIDQAYEFCQRLATLAGLPIRLPSESEWEYACRANTSTPYFWGNSISREVVNYRGVPDPDGALPQLRQPGFSGLANAFGLYDMHGNVWEWCSDVWHEDYEGAPQDGSAWTSGGDAGYHVQRGGSWADPAVVCRSAFRVGDIGRNTDNIVGIRVGCSLA